MNSTVQKEIIHAAKKMTEEAVVEMYCASFPEKLSIADLGCSSGPNTLTAVSDIVTAVERRCHDLGRPPPEFQLFLNDLPGNDFNTVFRSLPSSFHGQQQRLGPCCFVAGVPGSFYGRLFMSKSLNFVHSSSSLHWLSQVPPELQQDKVPINKGEIYISKRSPPSVLNAYYSQFKRDFSNFLRSRSEEIVSGGQMVLILIGRKIADPSEENNFYWELLSCVLMDMVFEDLIKEEKVDSFNLPYYQPSSEEVMIEIQREGSFSLKSLTLFEVDSYASQSHNCSGIENESPQDNLSRGQRGANHIRAVVESMLISNFGEDVMDDLFLRYSKLLEEYYSKKDHNLTNLVVSLMRKS